VFTRDATTNGARVQNNSWFDGGGPGAGYTANARRYDQLVRDPDDATAEPEQLAIVFSAGNRGPGASTITPPHEAKNLIVVGNSLTFRPGVGAADDIRGISNSSSRGPAIDGRLLPNVVAPGTNVPSAWSATGDTATYGQPIPGTGTPDPANPGAFLNQYMFMSGTSMAAPHVSGACALLVQWWQRRTGRLPSAALLKALLVNGAEDLAGGPDGTGGALLGNIPDNSQGWGRVSLENVLLQAPTSDRGPKIFSDQRQSFTANGQEYTIRVTAVDPGRPLRITLAWTDAPGAVNASPALVNDLDLEVLETATGTVYRGNVFANGFSTPGGAFDTLNNVECVYVEQPSGVYEVSVVAGALTGNARPPFDTVPWQDFAIVLDNAEVPPAAPVNVVPVVDRSGSMVAYGYTDTTRAASRQFVDLLGIDDAVGVTSFGDTGDVEFPAGAPVSVRTITGQAVRDDAKASIDAIGFGGCTFMGDGIAEGSALLSGTTGPRALLLLSDGYDNKGCDELNPAKPSALDAVAMLPADLTVHTCAMGPWSDQILLEQVAAATDGRYYFMPTIDDLFEIYNYIRGQVSGTSVVANETAAASESRVAAFVDATAVRATFALSWGDPERRYVSGVPAKPEEFTARLRMPGGNLLHPDASDLRRVSGAGYVAWDVPEPAAGRWHVEVRTPGDTHLRYTVGVFVDAPLRLDLTATPIRATAGVRRRIRALVVDPDGGDVGSTRISASAVSARLDIPTLRDKYRDVLAELDPPQDLLADGVPPDVARLSALQELLLKKEGLDITATSATPVPLRGDGRGGASGSLVLSGMGSTNLMVTVSGTAPSHGRYVRKELVSLITG
jgi:subtilisin family serine protease